MNTTAENPKKQPKGLFEKLKKRILREFVKVKYIGDIRISDEEYELLLQYFSTAFRRIKITASHEIADPLFAVALVQIGIRNYDGKFWCYVSEAIDGGINPVQQGWIGRSFVKTLTRYHKIHVGPDEMVNNILMHSFITKYYAADFFDFLYAYYQKDLDRDLSRHTKEMRNYLIQSMKKGEKSVRSYKIKKHTSDAVTANENGCKIRIRRILRLMDNYFFNGVLPENNSNNRVTQLFIDWAKTSKMMEADRKEYSGMGRRGKKRFSSPYLKFDFQTENFILVLPSQIVRLEEDEAFAEISWKIHLQSGEYSILSEYDDSVTGCKTRKIKDFVVPAERIFDEIKTELIKNETEVVRRFVIRNDSVRFFDEEWDMINAVDYLPIGNAFAFTQDKAEILSDSTIGVEKCLGLNLYSMSLNKGDVVKFPDGKVRSVGKEMEEGILLQHYVPGVKIFSDSDTPVYSSAPLIYFRMSEELESGTILVIDGNRYRLNSENCMKFNNHTSDQKKGYILKTETFELKEGLHTIRIDIPNERKKRSYPFAYIDALKFEFIGAPYIFKEQGQLVFNEALSLEALDDFVWPSDNGYMFDILPDEDYLRFSVNIGAEKIDIRIFLPVFKWKFDQDEWETSKPDEIWFKEFPQKIYLKYPEDKVSFYMDPPEVIDAALNDNEDNYEVSFVKNKQEHMFLCDTTKMPSWFGRQDPIRKLYVAFENQNFVFARVITKCILHSSRMEADSSTNELVLKSNISGLADCFVDVAFQNEILVEKARVTTRGVRLKVPMRNGRYTVTYYEKDDEDDEFGLGFDEYVEFSKRDCIFKNPYDLSSQKILVKSITKCEKKSSVFKAETFSLSQRYVITDIVQDDSEPMTYYGVMRVGDMETGERVKIKMLDMENRDKAYIFIMGKNQDAFTDCLYDSKTHNLVTGRTIRFYMNMIDASAKLIRFSVDEYYFSVIVK